MRPDLTTFVVDVPEEPPDMSVVAGRDGGVDGAGVAWMRNDPLQRKGNGVWYPAGPVYFHASNESTITSLSWKVLIALHGHLTVLRWGNGADSAAGGAE